MLCGDALGYLKQLNDEFDLLFLDPPFNQSLVPKAIEGIEQGGLLAKDGLIYIECETQNAQYNVPPQWRLLKESQTSQVTARLYQG